MNLGCAGTPVLGKKIPAAREAIDVFAQPRVYFLRRLASQPFIANTATFTSSIMR